MAVNDPIADMLTRIRNGSRVGAKRVSIRRNKVCLGIAKVLKDEGYILDFASVDDATGQGNILVDLKFGDRGEKLLTEIKRASKPGRRLYKGATELPRIYDGLGISIVSTSQGVLSDRECRRKGVGGELLCTVF